MSRSSRRSHGKSEPNGRRLSRPTITFSFKQTNNKKFTNLKCEEKRKKLRLELKQKQSEQKKSSSKTSRFSNIDDGPTDPNSLKIDEDDPDKFRHSVYVMTCKLFADIERLKVRESEKQAEEKYAIIVVWLVCASFYTCYSFFCLIYVFFFFCVSHYPTKIKKKF